VTDLSPLAGLQCLQKLSLPYCHGVTDVSPLSGLQSLESLDLYDSGPAFSASHLKALAGHPRLTSLIADAATGLPREVLSQTFEDNCLPRLRAYFSGSSPGADTHPPI